MSESLITSPARARQLIDFKNLRYERNITPTDIDGMLDFGNELFIWFEMKHTSAPPISPGQKVAFERVCDNLTYAGKQCCFIIAEHSVDDPQDDVDASAGTVLEYRYSYEWREPISKITVKEAIEKIRDLGPLVITGKQEGPVLCDICKCALKGWEASKR